MVKGTSESEKREKKGIHREMCYFYRRIIPVSKAWKRNRSQGEGAQRTEQEQIPPLDLFM